MAEKEYRLIDYYLKGINPYAEREVLSILKNDIQDMFIDHIDFLRKQNKPYYLIVDKLTDAYMRAILKAVDQFSKINNVMEDNGREHLFKDARDVVKCYDVRAELLKYMPESECNKIMNCDSYESYQPAVKEEFKSKTNG